MHVEYRIVIRHHERSNIPLVLRAITGKDWYDASIGRLLKSITIDKQKLATFLELIMTNSITELHLKLCRHIKGNKRTRFLKIAIFQDLHTMIFTNYTLRFINIFYVCFILLVIWKWNVHVWAAWFEEDVARS